MRIEVTPITMSEEEAMKVARGGGNIIGKAMFGKKDITLQLWYLENREVIFNLDYQPAPLMRWLQAPLTENPDDCGRDPLHGQLCRGAHQYPGN